MMRTLVLVALCLCGTFARGQQISAPVPQPATVVGTATDDNGDPIPGATVVIDGPETTDHHALTAAQDGTFSARDLRPAVPYRVTVSFAGFADWHSDEIKLMPGQVLQLTNVKLLIKAEVQSVAAVLPEVLATQEVHAEEQQRVLGIIPNFYVVYGDQFVPLSAKLKFQLALRSTTDVVSFAAAAFVAGLDQAADHPNYVQGAKGFGQRLGADYTDAATDIIFGGAVLPSLLHQDPRYFYQGTGTKKSRFLHAISAPFICKGDKGQTEFNFSSIGGDLISGSLSNIYYPPSNRGAGLVFDNAALATGGRMINALAQEFILSKFTSRAKKIH